VVKNNILLLGCCGLLACATTTSTAKTSIYDNTCTKTENYGKIDAHEVINMQNKTTFEATEYIDCADGRNLVVITWEGVHDTANANLAAQVMTNFFSHFHPNENVQYLLVPEESGENVFVYKFENYEPQRTIMSF
jgi:hypothetical protein